MKFLGKDEAYDWFRDNDYKVSDGGDPITDLKISKTQIESDSGKRIDQSKCLLKCFEGANESFLYFSDWSVWPSGEQMHLFERLSSSYGEIRPLIERPGHLFSSEEFLDLTSFVILGATFLWDMYVLDSERKNFLFFSHDEFVKHSTT